MVFSPSSAKTHTQRVREYLAWRNENPQALAELLAANAVKRGSRWLNRHAPPGWWRNCLNVGRSRVRTMYGGEDALCMAFECDPRFADSFGYVRAYNIQKPFDLDHRKLCLLGFDSHCGKGASYPGRHPEVVVTGKLVDEAWEHYLTHPTGDMTCTFRHKNTEVDRRLETLDFAEDRKPNLLERLQAAFS